MKNRRYPGDGMCGDLSTSEEQCEDERLEDIHDGTLLPLVDKSDRDDW